jgi:hypothetical protein
MAPDILPYGSSHPLIPLQREPDGAKASRELALSPLGNLNAAQFEHRRGFVYD